MLLSFGDRAMEFAQKNAVLLTAVVALIVVGVPVIYMIFQNRQAGAMTASDELNTLLNEMDAAPSADAAVVAADKIQNIRDARKGDKGSYPYITAAYARACYELGVRYDSADLLDRSISACNDLLQNYPDAPVAQLKDFEKVEGQESGKNLLVVLRSNAEKAKADIQSPEYAKATSGEGIQKEPEQNPRGSQPNAP